MDLGQVLTAERLEDKQPLGGDPQLAPLPLFPSLCNVICGILQGLPEAASFISTSLGDPGETTESTRILLTE